QYVEINVGDLERFEADLTLDAQSMKASGLITLPKVNDGIKILGNGELTKKLHVRANAFTASAKEKIEKAGGTAEEV
ncbi:MAG: uL15 family ribosomal protein, partial [Eubacteriales bacterium]|nr:uL15 family ribosomal protein [Eubacteriales bacterium]